MGKMRVLSLIFAALSVLVLNSNADVDSRWLWQRLDHYNPLERTFWDQRYIANNDYFVPNGGGPIFIYIGGGVEIYDEYISRGVVHDLAEELNGYLFALEHRYYGISRPTEDLSTENLRYLNADQALGDIARFITFIKENYNGVQASSVFLFGRGVGASLAVWARQKFPHLVSGVWASSAPLRVKTDFLEYYENVGQTIARVGGEACYFRIFTAFNQLEELVLQNQTEMIQSTFNLCSEPDSSSDADISTLFESLAGTMGQALANGRYGDIELACNELTNPAEPNALNALSNWIVSNFYADSCHNTSYADLIDAARDTTWSEDAENLAIRQNYFLECSQFATFTTSHSSIQPFGQRFPVSYFYRICADIFGEELINQLSVEEAVRRTNDFFGSNNPRGVTNVFFTHGELDPTRNLGVLEDLNPTSPAVVITLQSFSRDLTSISANDNMVLRETKVRGRELFVQWNNEEEGEYVPEPVDPEGPGETEPPIDPETTPEPEGTTDINFPIDQ